jgi:NADH-quinone oxidoreductase subunit J
MIETVIFYLFATILVGSSLAVITMRNPVHSVLFLILAFFNAAGLFILLGAEFLSMLLVIVYVGAVAVLFLFVVMMLNVNVEEFRKGLSKYSGAGLAVALLLLAEMVFLFHSMPVVRSRYIAKPISDAVTNTEALGLIMYTDYALLFQLAGMVLLVAMIGAITLCYSPKARMRKQKINKQVSHTAKNSIEIVKVEPGKGVS